MKEIEVRCCEYLREEPDEQLRSEINLLLKESKKNELSDRMNHQLRFGTAGLRGRMEAGYNRMNLVSVYRFSYALTTVLENYRKVNSSLRIVIGFDGRKNSDVFATEAAAIFKSLKCEVLLFQKPIPTPLGAYAVKYFSGTAGIMITASHNPKYDNGIKLFDAHSAQANGSILKEIEMAMEQAPSRTQFLLDHSDYSASFNLPAISDEEVFNHYLNDIKNTQFFRDREVMRDVPVVYTPLHGVGKKFFLKALQQENFNNIFVVKEQSEPDGQFPTVDFPNPEENHTLDYAHAMAVEKNISWVFANDPDADRLQVSYKNHDGRFQKLSGNQMGAMLGYFAIKKALSINQKPLVASSIVSSRMLKTMSEKMGAHYVDALTGFSNIVSRAGREEKTNGNDFVFAYEEAIGFLIGQVILDKDGISTGARFMEIVGYLAREKLTPWQFLDDLYLQFGMFEGDQWSMRFADISGMKKMSRVMSLVRSVNTKKIAAIFGESECQKFDLLDDQTGTSYEAIEGDVVIFEATSRFRLIIRPSGTEPKIKFYLELFDQATNSFDLSNTRSELAKKIVDAKSEIGHLFSI